MNKLTILFKSGQRLTVDNVNNIKFENIIASDKLRLLLTPNLCINTSEIAACEIYDSDTDYTHLTR